MTNDDDEGNEVEVTEIEAMPPRPHEPPAGRHPMRLPDLPNLAFGVYRDFIDASIEMLRHGDLPRNHHVALVALLAVVHSRENDALVKHAVACGAPDFQPMLG